MVGDGITDLEAVQETGAADLFIGYGGVVVCSFLLPRILFSHIVLLLHNTCSAELSTLLARYDGCFLSSATLHGDTYKVVYTTAPTTLPACLLRCL
jgi:hypothetical protein